MLIVPEFGSLTTSQLVEKVRGLQELAFQLGLEEGLFGVTAVVGLWYWGRNTARSTFPN